MRATNRDFIGIEAIKPVKVLRYWGYSKAYVQAPQGREYILNPNWTAWQESKLFERLQIQLAELRGPKARADNKETYLYLTEDGREVAVLFKDGWAAFGTLDDIMTTHAPQCNFPTPSPISS